MRVPDRRELTEPLLNAMKQLGGSGTVEEIYLKVIENEKITDKVLADANRRW